MGPPTKGNQAVQLTKPIVIVTWNDAADHGETWVDAAEAQAFGDSDCQVTSVGYLVCQTEKYITLAGDYDAGDNNYGTVRKIPMGMVEMVLQLGDGSNKPHRKPRKRAGNQPHECAGRGESECVKLASDDINPEG